MRAAAVVAAPAPRGLPSIKAPSIKALFGAVLGGRAWIGLLACALIGIVTMQVVLLKLNNRTGDALQRVTTLQRQNAVLGIENSEGRAAEAVEARARAAGMAMTAPGNLHFLQRAPSQGQAAARALRAFVVPSDVAGITVGTGQASQSFTTLSSGETAAAGLGG